MGKFIFQAKNHILIIFTYTQLTLILANYHKKQLTFKKKTHSNTLKKKKKKYKHDENKINITLKMLLWN